MSSEHAIAKAWLPARRELIGCAASAAGLAFLGGDVGRGEEPRRTDWIDAHVHVWTPDTAHYPLAAGFTVADMQPRSFTPEELLAHARPCGVERVVLIQMSFYGADNAYMLQAMRDHPGTFSGVAVVDENRDPATAMKRLARQGVRGFRIRPSNRPTGTWLSGEGMQAMWRCGADEGLAMCHLIDPAYLPSVEQMCRTYPRTPVVIDHFARIGVDGTIRPEDLDQLCRLAQFPQVTLKVSAYYALGRKKMPYHDLGPMVRRVREEFGVERLMWASDCPYQVQDGHTYRASIELIQRGLDFLSASDREWLLKKTAERVFFA